ELALKEQRLPVSQPHWRTGLQVESIGMLGHDPAPSFSESGTGGRSTAASTELAESPQEANPHTAKTKLASSEILPPRTCIAMKYPVFALEGQAEGYFAKGSANGWGGGAVWLSMLIEHSEPHMVQTRESAASLSIL